MSGSRLSAEDRVGSRQRLQGEANESKENQCITDASLRPVQTTAPGRRAKVCLVPFSLSNAKSGQLQRLRACPHQQRRGGAACKKPPRAPVRKARARGPPLRGEAAAVQPEAAAPGPPAADVPAAGDRPMPDEAPPAADRESSQDGDSDEDATSGLDDFSGLSPYEKKRLKNISENAKFFASLQLSESAARLQEMIKKRQPTESKRKKPRKRENEIGCRRSMRLLKVDPSGISLPETAMEPEVVADENPLLPPGPLDMTPENQNDSGEQFKGFLQIWAEVTKTSSKSTEKDLPSIQSYKANLDDMALNKDTVQKVTRGSVSSIAVHPSETRTLVAVGAKSGQVGLWDLTQQPKEDGVYVLQPHTQPVSCLYFSPANPAHILSLSYDGTLRCGDFSRAVFEEVYRDERSSFSSFDFLAENASTLIVGHWDGSVSLVDRRTPGTSYEKLAISSMTKIRTVHVHPVHRQYVIAAGLRDVHIYDVRHLRPRGNQPLVSTAEHTKSIASAYFSPRTGNRVVTTCADCKLRIFDSSCISSQIPLVSTIRHNTTTGRWLTRFQAVWDPKREDCVIVGSMAHPRRVEILHETGTQVHSFFGEDYLASVCSINAMHPTRYVLAGGNSSGKVHVFLKAGGC